jgi:probable F420-dependent oxidoreductase
MQLGRLGVFVFTDGLSAREAGALAMLIEHWGYGAIWIPEVSGRNVLVHAASLVASTIKIVVATGIANIYARDPQAMRAAQLTLAEQSHGRFLLGVGVSHAPLVAMRGHEYAKPVSYMREYLTAMRHAPYTARMPDVPPPTVIAALGPKMLELAREAADGAHPYNVTPEHTAQARAILGPDKWLCTEQMVLLETNATRARATARRALAPYLGAANYVKNFLRLGFTDEDCAGGGSDRLIDAIVAWGDIGVIRARIQAHWDAGATHVCVQPLLPEGAYGRGVVHEQVLDLLAPLNSAHATRFSSVPD